MFSIIPNVQPKCMKHIIFYVFFILLGAELHVRGSVFKIVELDLWTFNFMNENKDMFTQDAIDKAKCFLESKGLLTPEGKDEFSPDPKPTEKANETNQNEPFDDVIVITKMNLSNIL